MSRRRQGESQLYALITHAEEPHMPQKAPKLPDETIAQIARWIDLGAPTTGRWSKRQGAGPNGRVDCRRGPRLLVVPAAGAPSRRQPCSDAAWVRTPIDRFILAALEAAGLAPNPPADRRVADPPRSLST